MVCHRLFSGSFLSPTTKQTRAYKGLQKRGLLTSLLQKSQLFQFELLQQWLVLVQWQKTLKITNTNDVISISTAKGTKLKPKM